MPPFAGCYKMDHAARVRLNARCPKEKKAQQRCQNRFGADIFIQGGSAASRCETRNKLAICGCGYKCPQPISFAVGRQGRCRTKQASLIWLTDCGLLRTSSSRPSEAGIAQKWAFRCVTIPDKAAPFRDDGSGFRVRAGSGLIRLIDGDWGGVCVFETPSPTNFCMFTNTKSLLDP